MVTTHFCMGAINKSSNQYEYPKIASKSNKYKCPCCEKDVIFRNGKIKQPHFAHNKSDNPCSYYDKPNETQIHKDAKLLMKSLLDNKRAIFIERKCNHCQANGRPYNNTDDYDICLDDYTETTKAVIEYKFKFNNSNKSADVALIENDAIKFIFEICHTNKTLEDNRPEPWFEIKAGYLIDKINSGEIIDEFGNVFLDCSRQHKCDSCKGKEEWERELHLAYLEQVKFRKKEEELESKELLLMSENDIRTKERKRQRELERMKEEACRKQMEEELAAQFKRRQEHAKQVIEFNKTCSICNINYCKCVTPNWQKDVYNIVKCRICDKRQCKCVRITNFFKKK